MSVKRREKTVFEELEPRILLSASPAPADDSPAVTADAQTQESQQEAQLVSEVLFVDANVENYESLIENLQRNIEVVMIGANENGIEKISSYLEDRQDISSLHIISHGGDGFLQLGNERLDSENVALTSSWGDAMNSNGNIFLYGCNVTYSDAGKAFVDQIGTVSNANAAASTDATGGTDRGGDWDLEYNLNGDASSVLSFTDYQDLLVANDATDFVITVTVTGGDTSFTFYTEDTNYNIDWDGNGTADSTNVSGNQTHDFGAAGTYTVRFSDLTDININAQAGAEKYTSIEQWGDAVWDANMSNAFYGASSLVMNATDLADM